MFCIRTMLLACETLSNETLDFSIDTLVQRFSWPTWLKLSHQMNGIERSTVHAYLSLKLHEKLLPLSSPRLLALYEECVEVIARMEFRGMNVDGHHCQKLIDRILKSMSMIEKEVYQLSGIPFNLSSSADTAKILYTKLRLNVPKNATITTRHFSTNSAVLMQIPHPICEKIINWRKLEHSLKCLRGLISAVNKESGRIHTEFDHISASGGRILTSNPNLQIVPKQCIVEDFSVRSVFFAQQGRTFLAADYSQLELRVLCQLSGDEQLMNLLNENSTIDIFERMAERFSTNSNAKCQIDRNKAKQLSYGIIYGMGAETLSQELNLSKIEAEELISNFFSEFPKVKEWIGLSVDDCRKLGKTRTFLGKLRNFEMSITSDSLRDRSQAERQTVNYIIQVVF
uniref:DNA-directed DNA polymerase n=1 Tax=Acrobeloides nanus TaxID=290746 RepID=A0A914DZU0_9BILA